MTITNKTIVEINSYYGGSTGQIMEKTAEAARAAGYNCFISSTRTRKTRRIKEDNKLFFGSFIDKRIHIILGKLTGLSGCFSVVDTFVFLKRIKKIQPDIIHLHNLHNSFLCLPLLFRYIKKNDLKVFWTLHDCWSFTGRCPHFQISKCTNWKEKCFHCHYPLKDYPSVYINQAHLMWMLKRKWFTGVNHLRIVTPSIWLMRLVKESYLKDYQVTVINNGVDLKTFHPTDNTFRSDHSIKDYEYVILGVAWPWTRKKGIDVFAKLAKLLGKQYRIVLVGIESDDKTDLPEEIIRIGHVNDPKELANIYSAADVFVNPTREEVFGLVNIEALACGTPVITFDSGGSPECIDDTCGYVVQKENIDDLVEKTTYVCEENPFTSEACIKRAQLFDSDIIYQKYVDLYDEALSRT